MVDIYLVDILVVLQYKSDIFSPQLDFQNVTDTGCTEKNNLIVQKWQEVTKPDVT